MLDMLSMLFRVSVFHTKQGFWKLDHHVASAVNFKSPISFLKRLTVPVPWAVVTHI